MGYSIAKISVNSWNTDGTTLYDRYYNKKTFKAVIDHLKSPNTDLFYGKGCDILDKNDGVLFHTADFLELENDNSTGYYEKKAYTLNNLKEIHEENLDKN